MSTKPAVESKCIKRKRKPHAYNRVRICDRIEILYDSQVHNMDLKELQEKYSLNLNTLRHMVDQHYIFGRVDSHKYKRKIEKNVSKGGSSFQRQAEHSQ